MRTLFCLCVLALPLVVCGNETDIDGVSTSFETVPTDIQFILEQEDDPLHRLIYYIKQEVDAIAKDKPIEIALDDKPLVSVTPLTGIIDVNAPDCLTDASIRRICDSGRVCKLIGHRWITDDHLGASEDDVALDQGDVTYGYSGWQDRECAVCGYKQSRHWTEWRSDAQVAQDNTQEELRRVEGQLREYTEQVKQLTRKLETLKGQMERKP